MSLTYSVGQKVTATATEADATGINVPVVPANLTWTISDVTIASVVTNADGTATFTALAVGAATVTVTDTAFNLTSTDTLTVTTAVPPSVPASIAITFGTPA